MCDFGRAHRQGSRDQLLAFSGAARFAGILPLFSSPINPVIAGSM
jgi:hypothetical protein